MDQTKDIHSTQRNLDAIIRKIQTSGMDEANKKAVIQFDRSLQLSEHLGLPRRLKLVTTIFLLARRYFNNDLLHLTTDQIKDCVRDAESKCRSPWTAASYKIAIKKWCRWLLYGDDAHNTKEVPKVVSWMVIHVKRKDRPHVKASDILTPAEVKRLIAAADRPRDRAFIAMLYELGARIGEIGALTVGSVVRDQYSYLIDLSGKTGHRTPRIVMSDPYLTQWLDQHPTNSDPQAPLWPSLEGSMKTKAMSYSALRALVNRLKQRAGIKKRIYPHLFRHSRVTHLLSNKLINESVAKVYFGWTPDSGMLNEYSHLISRDADEAILAIHGIKIQAESEEEPTRLCPRCRRPNAPEAKFCIQCSSILDTETAFTFHQQRTTQDDFLAALLRDPEIQKLVLAKLQVMELEALKRLLGPEAAPAPVHKALIFEEPLALHEQR